MKEAIIKEIRRDDSKLKDTAAGDANGKKKRVRIGKERVDVNAVAGQQNGKKRDNAPGPTSRVAVNIIRTRTASSRSSRQRFLTRT